jgi:hypothetical protein
MDSAFDIVMREDDFVLYSNGKPFYSKHGNEVSHNNARLLRLAITHELFTPGRNNLPLNLLTKLTDVRVGSSKIFDGEIDELIKIDQLLQKDQNSSLNPMNEIFLENPFLFDFIFLNSSSIASSLTNFLIQKEEDQTSADFIVQCIMELSIEQQLVLNALLNENSCGLIIHYLLLSGHISLTEYAAGILICQLKNNHLETVDIIQQKGEKGLAEIQQKLSIYTLVAFDFLTLCKNENKISVIEEIIKRGEDNQTEFKSTLRWDLRQGIKNAAIEHASLKTICAFLNSEGGDLLIGVRDDGSIEGIETDKFENDDRFLLHLWTLIKTCMGQEVVEWVKTSLQKFGDKTVCRVNCKRARKPVFLNQKGFDEAFFIRVGPSSSNLEISSALKYIKQHFKGLRNKGL